MISNPAGYLNSGQGLWGRLGRGQQLTLVGLVCGAIVIVGWFAGLARTPEFAVAFASLRDDEAAAIVAKLKEQKVPYEVGERGTIKVPSAQVEEVRLMMAGQGLPQRGGASGFELFDQNRFGLTEFAEKINYQRALEGELSRTIGRLDTVETARVHLAIPQPSLFTSQQKEPTAAVVVQVKPGRRLDADQVAGITQLVAGSVDGLKPRSVSVMDTAGTVLGEQGAVDDPTRQSGTRTAIQRTVESRLEAEVRQLLHAVVGPDRTAVRVNAELDWDQYEANMETFSPQQKAPQVRSQRQVTESQAGGAQVGGVPGAESNVPTYPGQVPGNQGQSQGERRDVTTNYELSRTVEKVARAPGGIKRLSVAVALDSTAVADADQVQAISRLVATAAGLDENRGDVVTLTSLPFTAPATPKPAEVGEAARQRELILSGARLLGMVLGPLLVGALVWMILPRPRRPAGRRMARSAADSPEALPDQRAGRLPVPAPDAEQARAHKELVGIARSDPAKVAQLIRTWMQEDGRPA